MGTSGIGSDGLISLLLEPVVVASIIHGNTEARLESHLSVSARTESVLCVS